MLESPFKRHEPLYLKYRPQSLAQLVGQDGVNRTLVNAIENNRLSHAYLFTGPRGTGKTSSARILAKSLNCKTAGRPTVEPCQSCACCLEITRGNSPAVFEIDAASNNSVDDARVLIERAPLVAVGGDYKVYIIDECHMLTKEAFNALLKTIEQPPPKVVFILATTEEHKVLPTIISRCQRLMFKLINQDALCRHLRYVADNEGIEIEEEALQLIARRSGGGLRDALSNLDQASLLSAPGAPATVSDLLRLLGALHEDVLLDLSRQIAERAGQSVINSVNQFLDEGREPQVVLQELARHFLILMKASYLTGSKQIDSSSLIHIVLGSESYIEGLLAQVSLFERAELSQIIEQLDRLEQTCRRSSQPAMHLEIGLLSLCHRHDIHLLNDLLARIQRLEGQTAAASSESQFANARPAQAVASRPAVSPQSVIQYASPPQHTQSTTSHAEVASQPAAAQPTTAQSVTAQPATAQPSALQHAALQQIVETTMKQNQQHESSVHVEQPLSSFASIQPTPATEITSIALAPVETKVAESSPGKTLQAQAEQPNSSSQNLGILNKSDHISSPATNATSIGAVPLQVAPEHSSDDESGDPRINELNADIEYFWQQVLDELQRRHLPTFSLASTHAFPLRIGAREVAIGVMKENFQKMLETKSEHLRMACQAVTGLDLGIRIRVTEANSAVKKPVSASRPAQASNENREQPESRSTTAVSAPGVAGSVGVEAQEPSPAGSEAKLTATSREPTGEFDSTMVKEAYKLFEGPGSRRIN